MNLIVIYDSVKEEHGRSDVKMWVTGRRVQVQFHGLWWRSTPLRLRNQLRVAVGRLSMRLPSSRSHSRSSRPWKARASTWPTWELATSSRMSWDTAASALLVSRISGLPFSFNSRSCGMCSKAALGTEGSMLWLRSSSTRLVRPMNALRSISRIEQRCRTMRWRCSNRSRWNRCPPSCTSGLPLMSNTWTVESAGKAGISVSPIWGHSTLSLPLRHLHSHLLGHDDAADAAADAVTSVSAVNTTTVTAILISTAHSTD